MPKVTQEISRDCWSELLFDSRPSFVSSVCMIIGVLIKDLVFVFSPKHTHSVGIDVHTPITNPPGFMIGHWKGWYLFSFGATSRR